MATDEQEMTLAYLQTARADIAAEATAVLDAIRGVPASSTTTTVRVNIPAGVRLPDGASLTAVLAHRTLGADGRVTDRAEGLVGGEFRRMPVDLVPPLMGRARS